MYTKPTGEEVEIDDDADDEEEEERREESAEFDIKVRTIEASNRRSKTNDP